MKLGSNRTAHLEEAEIFDDIGKVMSLFKQLSGNICGDVDTLGTMEWTNPSRQTPLLNF